MSPLPWRCLLFLLAVVTAGGEVRQSNTQTPANALTAPGSEQLLLLIVRDVTDRIQPLVNNLATRIDRLDSRLVSFGTRLDGIETRLGALDSRTNTRVDELVSQMNNLSSRVDQGQTCCDELRTPSSALPCDCSELPSGAQSGIHRLRLGLDRSGPAVSAFCDLEADGGGWTVIQRRADVQPRLDFDRDWAAYREGFGELDSEFWWGLENVWQMTGPADRQYQLWVNLADFEGGRRHAVYQQFRVASGANGYQLTVDGYSGDAGDSMNSHNGMKFSTKGRDQDIDGGHCAEFFSGGWWFEKCYRAYLNGLYRLGAHSEKGGVHWGGWRHYNYSLKESEMKIRPVNMANMD